MATKAQRKTTKKKTSPSKQKILDGYMNFVLEHGKEPVSVFRFMKDMNALESDFYKHFGSFQAIPKYFWKEMVDGSIKTCTSDSNWTDYSSREKFLAFFFTLAENLKNNRSFTLWSLKDFHPGKEGFSNLSHAKDSFKEFATTVLGEGLDTEEVVERPIISKRYNEILWIQFIFILNFWKNDDSAGFENTDAAIEKSVNLAFELLGKSALDSMVDFGKFLFNNTSFRK